MRTDPKTVGLLEAAIRQRDPLMKMTNALRLVNGAGDGLPGLVLEQYDRHVVIHLFDKCWFAQQEALAAFVKSRLGAVYLIIKDRTNPTALRPDEIDSHVWIEEASSQTLVNENKIKFEVDLNDGLNTGLFLDMRRNRTIVSGLSKDRKVLNTFAYTCAFGVACRMAGAASVVNVDIGRKCLERGRKNYALNAFVPQRNEFIRADAIEYIRRAVKKDNRFDVIILDPPSFARNDNGTFSVKKDLAALIRSALAILDPKGVLFVSTNLSEITHAHLEEMVRQAGQAKIKSIERLGQDVDFTGSGRMPQSYLAALLVEFGDKK